MAGTLMREIESESGLTFDCLIFMSELKFKIFSSLCYELATCTMLNIFLFCVLHAAISCYWPSEPLCWATEETINLFKAPQTTKRGERKACCFTVHSLSNKENKVQFYFFSGRFILNSHSWFYSDNSKSPK